MCQTPQKKVWFTPLHKAVFFFEQDAKNNQITIDLKNMTPMWRHFNNFAPVATR